jgi:hypothetical protein
MKDIEFSLVFKLIIPNMTNFLKFLYFSFIEFEFLKFIEDKKRKFSFKNISNMYNLIKIYPLKKYHPTNTLFKSVSNFPQNHNETFNINGVSTY